jgi:Co/Zn/Cd efflux system component
MALDVVDKAPLLSIIDDDSVIIDSILLNAIALRPRSPNNHCHVPDEKFDYGARNRLILVLILCFIFMIIEIIGKILYSEFNTKKTIVSVYLGGVLSNSTAVVTDATHMGIDVASFVISLSAMYLATKQPTRHLSFGYVRAGLLF